MNYTEFIQKIFTLVSSRLPEGLQAKIQSFEKNNEIERKALTLETRGESLSASECRVYPVVFLERFYDRYEDGVDLDDIAEELVYVLQAPTPSFSADLFDRWDFIESRVTLRLCNAEKNRSRLKKLVFLPYLDLAVLFQIHVETGTGDSGTVLVTREMVENMKISTETLYETALENSRKQLGSRLVSMRDVLEGCVGPELVDERLYVLTNRKSCYGASVILYTDEMKKLADELESDLVILPSSIHEGATRFAA